MLDPIRERVFKAGRPRWTSFAQFFCPLNTYTITREENGGVPVSAIASAHPTGIGGNVAHSCAPLVRPGWYPVACYDYDA